MSTHRDKHVLINTFLKIACVTTRHYITNLLQQGTDNFPPSPLHPNTHKYYVRPSMPSPHPSRIAPVPSLPASLKPIPYGENMYPSGTYYHHCGWPVLWNNHLRAVSPGWARQSEPRGVRTCTPIRQSKFEALERQSRITHPYVMRDWRPNAPNLPCWIRV